MGLSDNNQHNTDTLMITNIQCNYAKTDNLEYHYIISITTEILDIIYDSSSDLTAV